MTYISSFGEIGRGDIAVAGGKGANLGELTRAGLPVPPGFVLNTAAYADFVEANGLSVRLLELGTVPSGAAPQAYDDAGQRIRALFSGGTMPAEIAAELRAAYGQLSDGGGRGGAADDDARGKGAAIDDGGGEGAAVAVRSSATAEDLASASFAGQQETYLNIRGINTLIAAVTDCWASLWTARAMAYRARVGTDPGSIRLAVVVQRMVESEAAGVMFTANPANGRRDQILIGAAWGLGESVVSGAVSTDDVVVEAGTGRVLSRRTANKEVMTVYAENGTREQPVPPQRRGQPVLDDREAAALAGYGTRIAAHYGSPQDIEWALAGGEFFILQARPITALPEPAAETPVDWPLPYPKGLYFRASIVEQLPDPLSPLFADMIDGSVTRSLNALLAQAFGGKALHEGDVALPTINGYAYYYYRTSGFWRVMGKSLPAVRALARGDADMGPKGWRERSHPRYVQRVGGWVAEPVEELPGQELLDGVSALLDAGTEYYTAVQSVIPFAATSELLFRTFYDRLVRRDGDPPAQTFLLGYDSEPILAEKALYDLAVWTGGQSGLATAIEAAPAAATAARLRTGNPPAGTDPEAWQQWCIRFRQHLDRFGHAVYNLDFLNPVPADDPSPLLETFRFYLRGQGHDPHRRQRLSAERREDQTRVMLSRLSPPRRAAFSRLLAWAQSAAPVREDALADIGLAWPLMRRMLLELGRRLVRSGVITESADVFWLRHTELQHAIEFGLAAPAGAASTASHAGAAASAPPAVAITGAARPVRAAVVEQRRMLWRGQRKATPPQLLPETRWMQKMFAGLMPAGSQDQRGESFTGVGASAGQVSAVARVLAGPEDFALMRPGEVLVARMTTPAWSSLFAMAAGVVTDVGGPLSHSSIVAREYGIPAVLGTGVATQRLTSGQRIRVDGDAGTVTIEHTASG